MARKKDTLKATAAESEGITRRALNKRLATGADYQEARRRKETATAELREHQSARAKLELAKARGELVSRSEVEESLLTLGLAIKSTVLSWQGELPGRLEGLSAGQMGDVLSNECFRLLQTIHAESKNLC